MIQGIEKAATGKALQLCLRSQFALVRPVLTDGVRMYQVDCGWGVEEAHDDDYLTATYHPFKDGFKQPWTGCRFNFYTATEAIEKYCAVRDAIKNGRKISGGEVIGSVAR
jgi:hypothetical protein